MSATLLLQKAALDGVRVRLEQQNKIKAYGPRDALAKWTPTLREHKPELIEALSGNASDSSRPPIFKGGGLGQHRQPQNLGGLGGLEHKAPSARVVYDPVKLQREADRRNAAAVRDGITDRFCACGRLATMAHPNSAGRDVWHCPECLDAYGRA